MRSVQRRWQSYGTEQPTGPPAQNRTFHEEIEAQMRGESAGQKENTAETGGERYSIVDPFVDSNGVQYDSAVLLDTEFFDGLSPRNWGGRLRDFVKYRSSTEPFILPVQDENGVTQQLEFAKTTDRVYKTGKSQHDVLDELSMTSDNISKLAVVHIDEIVDISDEDIPYYTGQDPQNNHGWLDRNGWLHRTAHVINAKNGAVYKLVVDIAKSADGRHILYATKGKINRVGTVQVNSLSIRGSGHNSNSASTLSQIDPTVKRKDLEYAYYVSRGEADRARKLLDEAAAESGHSRESDWRLYHSVPNSQTGVSIADADQMYGGDGIFWHLLYGRSQTIVGWWIRFAFLPLAKIVVATSF